MKRRAREIFVLILLTVLFFALALLCGLSPQWQQTGISAYAATDEDWVKGTDGTPTAEYDSSTGESHIQGITAKGVTMTYKKAVKLDGLQIELRMYKRAVRAVFGFALCAPSRVSFGDTSTNLSGSHCPMEWEDTLQALVWPDVYENGSQTRMFIATSYDYNQATSCYTDAALTNNNCGVAGGIVMSNSDELGIRLQFAKYSDTVWAMQYTITKGSGAYGQATSATLYLPHSAVENGLDADGNTYIVAEGFPGAYVNEIDGYLCIEDTSSAENVAVANAQQAYEAAIEAITDLDSYRAAHAARDAYGTAVSALSEIDQAKHQQRMQTLDAALLAKSSVAYAPEKISSDWNAGDGDSSAFYNPQTGETRLVFGGYGASRTYSRKVKLENLKITMRVEPFNYNVDRYAFGFGFTSTDNCTSKTLPCEASNAFCATFWVKQFTPTQTRLYFGRNHDVESDAGNIGYQDSALTSHGLYGNGLASSLVYDYLGDAHDVSATMTFHKEGNVWAATMTYASNSNAWSGNVSKVYFDAKWVNSVLDENGELYITAFGIPNSQVIRSEGYLTVEDDSLRTARSSASTAVSQYSALYSTVGDASSLENVRIKRSEAISCLYALPVDEQSAYLATVLQSDAFYLTDETVQTKIREIVKGYSDQARNMAEILKDESNITGWNVGSAVSSLQQAQETYAGYRALLTVANQAYFENSLGETAYIIQKGQIWQSIMLYANAVSSIDVTATESQILTAIYAAKNSKQTNLSATVQAQIEQLTEADRSVVLNKISEIDCLLGSMEKKYLLPSFEAAVKNDLSLKENLDAAKQSYAELTENGKIENGDPLYARYSVAYAALKLACENYVIGEIVQAERLLNVSCVRYSDFSAAKEVCLSVDFSYLTEESDRVSGFYKALLEKLNKSPYNCVAAGNTAEAVWTQAGLSFELSGQGNVEFLYLEKLNVKEPVSVRLRIQEIAYYNTENGDSNKLCFYFTDGQNVKSVGGLSVVIGLSPTFSLLEVYVGSDKVAERTLQKLNDGDELCFELSKTDGGYSMTVNGETVSIATSFSAEELYFSLGDDKNNQAYANKLYVVSINDCNFARPNYAVLFNLNYKGAVGNPEGESVAAWDGISRPADPVREGYLFGGWYKEAACRNEWDFENDTLSENQTLYAKWTPISAEDTDPVEPVVVETDSVLLVVGLGIFAAAAVLTVVVCVLFVGKRKQ